MLMLYDNTGVTVELGDIVASGVDLWDFEYPVPRNVVEYNGKTCAVDFDKVRLQEKIVNHYRFRQIGQETVGRFKHYLKTRMQEIMPYYVQVYEFDAKFRNIEDPLESYNLIETFQQETSGSGRMTGTNSSENSGTVNSESSGTTSGTSEKVSKFSDTPQGTINNLDTYMTNATKENNTESGNSSEQSNGTSSGSMTGSSEQSTEDSGTTSHTLTRKGNIGVQPLGGEVMNIRNAFINIDLQIIEDLADLFLKVY